jgi:osmotically inducible lipoprotein OsmB
MLKRISIVVLGLSLLAACDHMSRQQQRALSGGAIGAGGGAVLGAVAGFNPLVGAAVGGAAGAAVGAATTPQHRSRD